MAFTDAVGVLAWDFTGVADYIYPILMFCREWKIRSGFEWHGTL